MPRMQTRPLVASLVALMGLWMTLRQLPEVVSSLFMVFSDHGDIPASVLMIHAVHFFSYSLIGVGLILLREKLASWLVPHEASMSIGVRALMAVGTALIGIYFIATGVVSLGESFAQQHSSSNPYLLWRGGASLAMGLVLFVGSVGIQRLWVLLVGLRRV